MTTPDPTHLRKLAEAATRGPWLRCGHDRGGCQCGQIWAREPDVLIAIALEAADENYTMGEGATPQQKKANAGFIAAFSPDVAIALLDRVAGLEAGAAQMKRAGAQAFEWQRRMKDAEASIATLTAERDRMAKALEHMRKYADELSGFISKAQYEFDELGEVDAWEKRVYRLQHDGFMASMKQIIEDALQPRTREDDQHD